MKKNQIDSKNKLSKSQHGLEARLKHESSLNKALAELSQEIQQTQTFEELTQITLAKARALTDSPFGYAGYIDPKTGHLIVPTLTHEIWDQCSVDKKRFIFERFSGLWGWVIDNKQPILTNNPTEDPRSGGQPEGHLPVHRFLSVPVLDNGEVTGQIALANAPYDYTETDLLTLQQFASIMAIGIERIHSRQSLKENETRFRTLIEDDLTGDFEASPDGTILYCNKAFIRMFGFQDEKACGDTNISVMFQDEKEARLLLKKIIRQKQLILKELTMRHMDGTHIHTIGNYSASFDDQGAIKQIRGYIFDITNRKEMELRRGLLTDILNILNRPNQWQSLIKDILAQIKDFTGLEAIGIRLREAEDYPYFETSGFPDQFVRTESTLCIYNVHGEIKRGAGGKPLLDCMCGRIITGQVPKKQKQFTENGSFWTNKGKKNLFTRGRCVAEGYRSIAIIPLRAGTDIIGLLQFNDPRPNRFSDDMIRFLEEIGATIGIAIQRMTQAMKIREAEERFRTLFDNLVIGVYQTTPDGRVLMVNPSLMRMLGFGSLEELQQRNLEQDGFEPGYERADFKERIEREGSVIGQESVWKRADGQVIYVRESARCVRDETGKSLYYEGTVEDVTEQKQNMNLLVQSEKQFRMLFQNAPFPRWVYDTETLAFLDVNEAAIRHYGYTRKEFLSMTLKDIRPAEEIPALLDNIAHEMDELQFSKNWHHRKKDGTIIEIEIASHAAIYNGKKARIVLAYDVTESKLKEKALHRSEELNRRIIESSNDCVKVLALDGTLLSISKGGQRLMEIDDVDQVLNKSWIEFWSKTDQIKVNEELTAALKGEIGRFQAFCPTARGTPKWWDVVITPIRNNKGEIEKLLSVSRDITERIEKEKILQWENNVKEALAQLYAPLTNKDYSIPEFAGIVLEFAREITGSRYGFVSEIDPETNENVIHAYTKGDPEYAGEFASGKRISFSPDQTGMFRGLFGHALNTRQSFYTNDPDSHPAHKSTPPGHMMVEKVLCAPAIFEDDPIGEIALANPGGNYTDRGLEAINRLAEFYALAIQRKRDYNSLIEAKKKAEESDKLKSSLLNNMSHEFRTPMNAILGFSSLLESEVASPDLQKMANRINAAGNRLMKTLDDILELSQLKAGIVFNNKVTFDVYEEVVTMLPNYRQAAQRKGLNLRFKGKSRRALFMVPSHFQRVVNHLVDNAIKFTDQGTITIELNEQKANDNTWIELTFSDTGTGIPPEHLSLIFEEFRQVSEGYERTHEGTGLGLTIAKQIVESYLGTISVESQPGIGSTFRITLPSVSSSKRVGPDHSPGIESGILEEKKPADSAPPVMINGVVPHILVVEDNTDNVDVIRFHLHDKGMIDAVANAEDALEMVRKKQYDIILMDIHLGAGKSGLDATCEIRKMPAYKHIPIIAVTGYTTSEDKKRIFDAGCSHYLGKPFTKEQLMKIIREAVTGLATKTA